MYENGNLKIQMDSSESKFETAKNDDVVKEPWELKLGLGQVGVLWGVVSGLMVMVFLFGLFAGREQGVKAALDNQGSQAIRLPITDMLANPNEENITVASSSAPVSTAEISSRAVTQPSSNVVAEFSVPSAVSVVEKKVEELKIEPEVKFDFSNTSSTVIDSNQVTETKPQDSKTIGEVHEALKVNDQKNVKTKSEEVKPAVKRQLSENKNVNSKTSVNEAVKMKPSSKIGSGWYVQVSAERSSATANKLVNNLKSQGVAAKIEEVSIKGTRYFRVLVGPAQNKDSAQNLREKVINIGVSQGTPFLKFVN